MNNPMNIKFSFDGKNATMTIDPMQPGEKAMLEAFRSAPGEIKIIGTGDELSLVKQAKPIEAESNELNQHTPESGTLREFNLRR
jgi:hypothetical protein